MPQADRGSVWIVDLGMTAKVRPCLVLSVPTDPQDRVLVTLVPHTTSVQGTRFEVAVQANFLRGGTPPRIGKQATSRARSSRFSGTPNGSS